VEHTVLIELHNRLAQPPVLYEMHLTGYINFFGQSGKLKDKFKAIVAD